MSTTRRLTKSPVRLPTPALAAARDALPAYSSPDSKKTYTPHQRFALLAAREFLKADGRGLGQHLHDGADPRRAVGLTRVPDHSTLQKAAPRRRVEGGAMPSSGRPLPPPAPAA